MKEKLKGPVSSEEFVRVWQQTIADGGTLDDCAERVGMTYGSACTRATSYRKLGIKLDKFKRGMKPLDVNALNAIIRGIK